jgi:MOSC domain-containing protein YiiM
VTGISLANARVRVVSIQVGKVRSDTDWTTGIFKDAVEGPVVVGTTGVDGDEQADRVNHGGPDKALCAYAAEHYPFWQLTFGLPVLAYGAFGENVTIDGAAETAVCIGDTWALGDLLLQVSQPRQPCWKLARKWGVRDFAEQVVASGSTGWYFRVLRGGRLQAGAACALVERPYPQWTITEANRMMYDPPPDGSAGALAEVPLLSASWRRTLAARGRAGRA